MFMCLSHLLFWKESTDWHCRESFKSPLCILSQRGFKMDPATNNGTQHTDQTGPSGSWGFRPVPSLWWLRTANHAALGQCSTRWKSSLKVCLHIFIVWWHFPVVVLHSFYRNDRKAVISSPLLLLQKINIIGLYNVLSALSDQNSRT